MTAMHRSNPVQTETCNNIDDNCNTQIDEGVKIVFYADVDNDSYGSPTNIILACSLPAGYVTNNYDCDDSNASNSPAAFL
jgi:hypothetical protein